MKTRKMWAEQRVFDGGGNVLCFEHDRTPLGIHQPRTPVLVTDATDMPDFEPGDRVRYRNENCEVIGHPFPRHELWLLPILWNCGYELVAHDMVTKLPRETSVLLRVTGPEEDVDRAVGYLLNRDLVVTPGSRFERVEDER